MTISLNARLDEQVLSIQAAIGVLLTSTLGDCIYVSMKDYRKIRITIDILNGSTVTGSAITLKQATDVTNSQSDEKPLAYTRMLSNIDMAASQAMAETAVTSNTFTTSAVNGKLLRYIIDVDSSALDSANGFDCLRLDGTGAANMLACSVSYDLYGARYSGAAALTN